MDSTVYIHLIMNIPTAEPENYYMYSSQNAAYIKNQMQSFHLFFIK